MAKETLEKGEKVTNKQALCGGLYAKRKLMRLKSRRQFYYVMVVAG